jgi:hypothetical protein
MNPTRFWTYRSPNHTEHFIDIVYNYGAFILTYQILSLNL